MNILGLISQLIGIKTLRLTKCILPSLTEVMGLTMNSISETHHFYERREYAFNVLLEYDIIELKSKFMLSLHQTFLHTRPFRRTREISLMKP